VPWHGEYSVYRNTEIRRRARGSDERGQCQPLQSGFSCPARMGGAAIVVQALDSADMLPPKLVVHSAPPRQYIILPRLLVPRVGGSRNEHPNEAGFVWLRCCMAIVLSLDF